MMAVARSEIEDAPIAIERRDIGHLVFAEFEIENVKVLLDAILADGFGNDDNTTLDRPTDCHLSGGLKRETGEKISWKMKRNGPYFVVILGNLEYHWIFEKIWLAFLSEWRRHVRKRCECCDCDAFFFAKIHQFRLLKVWVYFNL